MELTDNGDDKIDNGNPGNNLKVITVKSKAGDGKNSDGKGGDSEGNNNNNNKSKE